MIHKQRYDDFGYAVRTAYFLLTTDHPVISRKRKHMFTEKEIKVVKDMLMEELQK